MTTPRLTTMEAVAQIIRKWRLIERTSKIDLCLAAAPGPLDRPPSPTPPSAVDTSCVRVCYASSNPACTLRQTIIIHNRQRVLATTYTSHFLQL